MPCRLTRFALIALTWALKPIGFTWSMDAIIHTDWRLGADGLLVAHHTKTGSRLGIVRV